MASAIADGDTPLPTRPATSKIAGEVTLQSRVGLNAANFFLAEVTGVVMPFLGTFLKDVSGATMRSASPWRLPAWACS